MESNVQPQPHRAPRAGFLVLAESAGHLKVLGHYAGEDDARRVAGDLHGTGAGDHHNVFVVPVAYALTSPPRA